MNIKQAKEYIKNSVNLYLKKDEFGEYRVPVVRQRPIFLLGAPGIGKTAVMEQIAQEGAIQIFKVPNSGMEEVIVGVVGILQLEVLEYRLKNEYGVDVRRRSMPYEVVRWIDNEGINPNDLNLTSDTKWVQDFRGNNLLLFTSEWCINWALQKNEGLRLREFNRE